MRSRSHLEGIEKFVEFSHNTRWNTLITDLDKPFDPSEGALGYCFKYSGPSQTIYRVVCKKTGMDDVDYRIKMHEYGHIYFGHLDEVYAEIDGMIYDAIKNNREELADYVNQQCGIDFGEELLERILDDPSMNHEIHNIAMDMEVNSKVLSDEDIEDLEKKISEFLAEPKIKELEKYRDSLTEEEKKKEVDEAIKKLKAQVALKLILPARYHDKNGQPFPNELTYVEYVLMIVQNLDQFIKMLVSISMGGNGDTSGVTSEDIQNALQGAGGGSGSGAQSLQDLMDSMGMGDNSNGQQNGQGGQDVPSDCPYKGIRDHQSPDSETADQERKDATDNGGNYSGRGGNGCGSGGGAGAGHNVKHLDPIEMSLEEVIQKFKSKVIEWKESRDVLWNWNRGINRTVIAPAYKQKVDVKTQPTVVFLIDVSGSMDTDLVDRCLNTIARKMKKINGGLKYNVITWSTHLHDHFKDIDPRKPVPRIHVGGGTRMAYGIKYFKENYDKNAILIVISDLEDYLDEWAEQEKTMKDYTMYAFNYGYNTYGNQFKYIKVKNFKNSRY